MVIRMPGARIAVLVTALVYMLGVSGAATAETPSEMDDKVVLDLVVEDWVETQTATAIVSVDLAVTGGAFAEARAEAEATLRKAVSSVTWRFTRFNRLPDDAGYERWRVVAQSRLPSASLGALPGQMKRASGPAHIQGRLHRPHADAGREPSCGGETPSADLRAGGFRDRGPERFVHGADLPPGPYRFRARRGPDRGAAPHHGRGADSTFVAAAIEGNLDVARKMVLTARVTLAAEPDID